MDERTDLPRVALLAPSLQLLKRRDSELRAARGEQASRGARSAGADGTRDAGASVAPGVSLLAPVNLRHI